MHPISVVFTLPEQNLQSILNEGGAPEGFHVSAFDRGNTTALDEGSLTVVDNEIDPATGTVKLKATFPNDKLKLWSGRVPRCKPCTATALHSISKEGAAIRS